MSKCGNCIHFDMCADLHAYYHNTNKENVIPFMCNEYNEKLNCDHFKDKSLFVELPCKVGDVVYYIPFGKQINEFKVAQIVIEPFADIGMSIHCYGGFAFDMGCIGKIVFLTKEEAEAKLKEMGESK